VFAGRSGPDIADTGDGLKACVTMTVNLRVFAYYRRKWTKLGPADVEFQYSEPMGVNSEDIQGSGTRLIYKGKPKWFTAVCLVPLNIKRMDPILVVRPRKRPYSDLEMAEIRMNLWSQCRVKAY
jgi:hypothetical protein